MRPYSLEEIAGVTRGTVVSGDAKRVFTKVSIDSRRTGPGDLFWAIVGERQDGHDFVRDVMRKGAGGAVCEHFPDMFWSNDRSGDGFGVIMTDSTLRAVRDLAAHYRREIPVKTIGVTGSVGKTSTKDLIVSVLSRAFPTYGSPGNLNSHIGLPLALLGMDSSYRYAVLEMAMRKRGEIKDLCLVAAPEIGVVTDISSSHIGLLGTVEEIALAKSELLEALPSEGLAVMCGDNQYVRSVSVKARCKRLFYGFGEGNHVRASDIESLSTRGSRFVATYKRDRLPLILKVPGIHQVQNALAAVALGLELGMNYADIRDGLENAEMSPMRMEVLQHGGITIINDAYNASPKSVRAALDLLEETPGNRKVAVLGDMLEMGSHGPSAHLEVGKYAAGKADVLVAVGELGKEIARGWEETRTSDVASWFFEKEAAQKHLKTLLHEGDVCLIKASRSMEFESVVAFLRQIKEL